MSERVAVTVSFGHEIDPDKAPVIDYRTDFSVQEEDLPELMRVLQTCPDIQTISYPLPGYSEPSQDSGRDK